MVKVRKPWFRILVGCFVLLPTNFFFADRFIEFATRTEAIRALQGTALLFTVCAAMALALYSNSVRGLRKMSVERIAKARDLVEKIFDETKTAKDGDIRELREKYICPLLMLSTKEWLQFDPVKEINEKLQPVAEALGRQGSLLLPRYLLRLEDEINEIGLLHISRVITGLHIRNISGTFLLIGSAVMVVGLSYMIPNNPIGNLVSVNLSISFVVFAVMELFLMLSYFQQEARAEFDEEEQ